LCISNGPLLFCRHHSLRRPLTSHKPQCNRTLSCAPISPLSSETSPRIVHTATTVSAHRNRYPVIFIHCPSSSATSMRPAMRAASFLGSRSEGSVIVSRKSQSLFLLRGVAMVVVPNSTSSFRPRRSQTVPSPTHTQTIGPLAKKETYDTGARISSVTNSDPQTFS